ncbi:MAG: mreC [Ignavibacteria bacterium]|nr:mreC [Ignavibacteria bacterium]
MQKFIKFILKYKEYVIFVALVVMSFSLISIGDMNKIGGFRTGVIGTIGWLQRMFSWIPNPAALKSENSTLRELNFRLSADVTKMRHSLVENQKLRDLLKLRETSDNEAVVADIVGRSTVEMRNYLILNKGKNEGIKNGMSVRTDAGLVGMVIIASDNYSLVEMITNKNVKIAAKIQRNGINGVLVWEGGEYLIMKNIPESFDVKAGDFVLTSNFSTKYMKDIPIGTVIKVEREQGSLFFKLIVKPSASFATLEQLFVMINLPSPEKLQLLDEMEKKLKINKR